ncbi:hypothetical protein, partial [Aliivibrio salmonicida]|uniref:hypothetical protein n=1 Tax=Aliivibrio salmonicida TaxID=40269 RepID=UPI003D0A21F7
MGGSVNFPYAAICSVITFTFLVVMSEYSRFSSIETPCNRPKWWPTILVTSSSSLAFSASNTAFLSAIMLFLILYGWFRQ